LGILCLADIYEKYMLKGDNFVNKSQLPLKTNISSCTTWHVCLILLFSLSPSQWLLAKNMHNSLQTLTYSLFESMGESQWWFIHSINIIVLWIVGWITSKLLTFIWQWSTFIKILGFDLKEKKKMTWVNLTIHLKVLYIWSILCYWCKIFINFINNLFPSKNLTDHI
jgi:hypothetical protein